MSAAIAITRRDLTAGSCGRVRRGAGRRRRRGGCWRSRWCWKASTGRARRRPAGWIGRRCGTGYTATMRRGSPGSRTAGAKRDRGGSTRAMWPNLCHGWRPAPTRWWTGWCAGGGRTFAPGSRTGSGSSCASGRSKDVASLGCRRPPCARESRGPTLPPRNALKKFPRGGSRRAPRGGPRQAAGNIDSGRGQVGQQGTLTRVWAKRGTRPRARREPATSGPTSSARSAPSAAPRRVLSCPSPTPPR